MKIGIIGAGSIGLLFAGYLGKKFDVTVFPRTSEQALLIESNGVTIWHGDSSFTSRVNGTCHQEKLNQQDLIFIAVKQYHLKTMFSNLNIKSHIPLVFLQNGMGHLPILDDLPHATIIIGSVEHGASRINNTIVEHNGIGKTNVSFYRGASKTVEPLLHLNDDHFPFKFTTDYERILIKKLLVNAMINPLTAILNVKNGILISNPNYFRIFQELYNEIIPMFSLYKRDAVLKEIIQICENTKENESSMLKDIKMGTKTEIDSILGVILTLAQEKNKQLPITWSLYQMIKGMEWKGENH